MMSFQVHCIIYTGKRNTTEICRQRWSVVLLVSGILLTAFCQLEIKRMTGIEWRRYRPQTILATGKYTVSVDIHNDAY